MRLAMSVALHPSFALSTQAYLASGMQLPSKDQDTSPSSGLSPFGPALQARSLLKKMIVHGVNVAHIAAALFISRLEIEAIAREEGLPLKRTALRNSPRAWSLLDISRLSRAWAEGEDLPAIAKRLDRTVMAVRKKRAALGLPARERYAEVVWTDADVATLLAHRERRIGLQRIAKQMGRSVRSLQRKLISLQPPAESVAIPADPSVVLTWEQASRLTPEERRGRRWQVRNSPTGLVIGFSRNACTTRWSVEMQHELAMRHFAHQSPDAVAEDFLLTDRTIVSQSGWLHLPRRSKKDMRKAFDPNLYEVYLKKMDYVRRECLGKAGFYFWTTRRNGRRISRLHQQTAVMRSGD
ncbi:hypothetical protein GCM10007866_09820 [Gluconobacter albidus]|uniref:Uncharacterized protein n=4 Tax=Gluconobacter albidus TaxID=318683 RepID=A0ABQ5WZB7_9PROT|nr:hypothetical protein GCM10007866_09820 [Gluconobacter albidus]